MSKKIKVRYTKTDTRFDYSSSLITQDFSESEHEHGVLVWDIESKDNWKKQFVPIENEYGFFTFRGKTINDLREFDFKGVPEKVTFRSIFEEELTVAEQKEVINIIKKAVPKAVKILPPIHNVSTVISYQSKDNVIDMISTINKFDSQIQFIIDYLKKHESGVTEKQIEAIRKIHEGYYQELVGQDKIQNDQIKNWNIESIEWDNLFSYGEGNKIDFRNLSGIIGIFGSNWVGKSSSLRAILWAIYNEIPEKSITNENILNKYSKKGGATITLSHLGKTYRIKREIKRSGQKASVSVDFESEENGKPEKLNEETSPKTDKNRIQALFGTVNDILLTNFASQNEHLKMIEMTQSQRKDTIHQFLGIDVYELFNKLGSKKKNELKAQLKRYSDKNLYEEIEEQEKLYAEASTKVRVLKKRQDESELKLSNLVQKHAKELEELQNDKTGEQIQIKIDDIQSRLDDLETSFDETEFQKKGEQYSQLKEKKKDTLTYINDVAPMEIRDENSKIEEAKKEIESIDESIKEIQEKAKVAFSEVADLYGTNDFDDLLEDEKSDSAKRKEIDKLGSKIERAEKELEGIRKNSGTFVGQKELYIGNEACVQCDFFYDCLDLESGSIESPLTDDSHKEIAKGLSQSFAGLEEAIADMKDDKKSEEESIRFTEEQYENIHERRTFISDLYQDLERDSHRKEKLEGIIEKCVSQISAINNLVEKNKSLIESWESEIETIEKYIRDNAGYIDELEKIKDTEKELAEAKDELTTFTLELDKSIREMTKAHDKEIKDYKAEVTQIKEDITEQFGFAKKTEGVLERMKKEIEDFEILSAEYQIYDYYCTAVHKDGVPSEIVRIALPRVNAEMKNILTMFNFNFDAEVVYDDETQKVQIYVTKDSDQETKIVVELGSGAQKHIIATVLRIAFSKVSSVPSPNFFINDEGFASFDKENLQQLPKLFELLKSYYKHVILITHLDEVKDMVEDMITVETYEKKGKTYSRIVV